MEILLAAALILGLFVVGRQSSDYKKGQQDYEEAGQLANISVMTDVSPPSSEAVQAGSSDPDPYDPYAAMLIESIDLSALQEVNSDVLGWIDIPGTDLSYPILQGENNDYYLDHTWKGESNSMGSVFLDCQVDPALGDFNTIIYGHRMRNLSMFGSLKFYEDISYWEENPSVYIVTGEEACRYDIYAAYRADPEDIIYGLKINSRPKKQELIQFGLEHSVIDTGITPTTFDRILTLSTCTGNSRASRWVVQAIYQVGASELPSGAGSSFEGTDDLPDNFSSNSGDRLLLPNTADTKKQQPSFNTPQILFLTAIFVLLISAEAILIAASFLYFRNRKRS